MAEICPALMIAAIILVNYPFLGIFAGSSPVLGLPPLVVYLFLIWLVLILLTFLMVGNGAQNGKNKDEVGLEQKRKRR